MSVEQQIVMKVPEEMVRAQVQAAVVAALSANPEGLVRAIVEHSLNQKQNHYDRETLLDKMLRQMIHEVAVAEFKLWIDGMRPDIKKQIAEAIGKRKKDQVQAMAEKLLESLTRAEFYVSIKDPEGNR